MAIHAHFTVTDFIVFSLTLLASMGIGIFYSRSGGAQQNNNEYLMAGRSMSSLPVAVSVLASFVSSIAILGNPAEVYTYGFQYWFQCFTNFISVPIMAQVFLPVHYNLRLRSSYEVSEPPVVSALNSKFVYMSWPHISPVKVSKYVLCFCTIYKAKAHNLSYPHIRLFVPLFYFNKMYSAALH